MKKIILIISVFILTQNTCFSQHVETLNRFNLQFESPSDLSRYITYFEFRVFGFDYNDYEVDIEVIRNNKKQSRYYSDLEAGAKTLAGYLGMVNINEAKFIKNVSKGYYVIGERKDIYSVLQPVIFLIIIDPNSKFAFEITIDCFNGNLDVGKKIANSFLFTS